MTVGKIGWLAYIEVNILLQAHSVRCMGSSDLLILNGCQNDPNAFCGVTRLVILSRAFFTESPSGWKLLIVRVDFLFSS